MSNVVNEFQGEFRFLSNFWPAKVHYDGAEYPSVEHAYVAAKTTDKKDRASIAATFAPGAVKRLGRTLKLREGWEGMKLSVMEDLVTQKFVLNPQLGKLLLGTGVKELIEGNRWGDTFWGVCNGVGKNNLGKILMCVRTNLRKTQNEQ